MLNSHQISRFCSQIHLLLAAGIPLLEALSIMQKMSTKEKYQVVIDRLAEGKTLAVALNKLFPPMVTVAIDGAEQAGNLDVTFDRLAKHYERQAETEEKIRSILIYPAFILILSLVAVAVLMIFVLPSFKGLFADLGQDLPLFSKILIYSGDFLMQKWYLFLVLPVLVGIAIVHYKKKPEQLQKLDALFLKSKIIARIHIIEAFRTLGSLLTGGIPIRQALKTVESSARNVAFQRILSSVREAVENGERLGESFAKYSLFPREAIQMISVGESSSNLDQMLLNIAGYYENEREVFTKRCVSLLEPALTLLVGLLVGVIAIALFLPMMNVISAIN